MSEMGLSGVQLLLAAFFLGLAWAGLRAALDDNETLQEDEEWSEWHKER